MATKNPADVAAKWARNLSGSTEAMKQGVQAVAVAPTAMAARNVDGYLQGVQNAVNSGKWQRGLNKVSLADWQGAMINKGLARIASGATEGKKNMQNFMQSFLPFVDSARSQLASQPRGSLEQNIQRSVTWQRMMANYKSSS